MNWLGLAGKRAVITGGASGIGRATAVALLEAGANVTILDQNTDAVEKAIADLSGSWPGLVSGSSVDVSSSATVSSFWEETGPTHVLCNCAGVTKDGWLTRMDENSWDHVISVNLKGTFLMTQGFARQRQAANDADGLENGSVINIASIVAKTGNLGQANYAASKAGVVGFTKTAAKELAADSIRVNVILPGFIATPMTDAVPDKVLARIIPTIPAARMGAPENIADAAVFLASERSSYITGAVIEVTGGLSM